MAQPAQDRTEKPTKKRRDEGRKRGQVPRSPDLSGSVILIVGIVTIAATGSQVTEALGSFMRATLLAGAHPQRLATARGLHAIGTNALATLERACLPVLGATLGATIVAAVLQAGGRPAITPPKLDLKRLSPKSGLKNMVGPNAAFEALKAIAKVGAVGAVVAMALLPDVTGVASKVGLAPGALGALAGSRALSVAERAAFAYLIIGLIDYAWRRRRIERSLRMTKQEVKEEVRQHSISAEVSRALKRRQAQMARSRMMAAVPEADVVLANPTHVAVALRYDGSRPAPEVVAKGPELIAAQIRRVAQEHGVPVITDPPLARTLYDSAEVGDVVPAELYAAVARVLAFVYRLERRSASAPREARRQRPAALGAGGPALASGGAR
jgi:flagellar biosynthetic protein FlhB